MNHLAFDAGVHRFRLFARMVADNFPRRHVGEEIHSILPAVVIEDFRDSFSRNEESIRDVEPFLQAAVTQVTVCQWKPSVMLVCQVQCLSSCVSLSSEHKVARSCGQVLSEEGCLLPQSGWEILRRLRNPNHDRSTDGRLRNTSCANRTVGRLSSTACASRGVGGLRSSCGAVGCGSRQERSRGIGHGLMELTAHLRRRAGCGNTAAL